MPSCRPCAGHPRRAEQVPGYNLTDLLAAPSAVKLSNTAARDDVDHRDKPGRDEGLGVENPSRLREHPRRYFSAPKIILFPNRPPAAGASSGSALTIIAAPLPSTKVQRPARCSMPAIVPKRGTSSPGRTA